MTITQTTIVTISLGVLAWVGGQLNSVQGQISKNVADDAATSATVSQMEAQLAEIQSTQLQILTAVKK